MQEVWKTNLQRQIFDAVRDYFPYSVSLINLTADTGSTKTACTQSEVFSYGSCLATNCATSSSPRTCVVDQCLHVLEPLSNECKLCLLINVGITSESILVCASEPETNYERSFGLMLLSKKSIIDSRVEGYLGNVSEARGYYQASVSPLHIVCLNW